MCNIISYKFLSRNHTQNKNYKSVASMIYNLVVACLKNYKYDNFLLMLLVIIII